MATNSIVRKGWVLKATDKKGTTFFYKVHGAYDKYGVGEQNDEYNDLIPDLPVYRTREIAESWKRRFKDELLPEAAIPHLITKPVFPVKIEVVPYKLSIG